jgi:hypothetical protein
MRLRRTTIPPCRSISGAPRATSRGEIIVSDIGKDVCTAAHSSVLVAALPLVDVGWWRSAVSQRTCHTPRHALARQSLIHTPLYSRSDRRRGSSRRKVMRPLSAYVASHARLAAPGAAVCHARGAAPIDAARARGGSAAVHVVVVTMS